MEFRGDIFSNKHSLPGRTDELIFFSSRHRSNECNQRGAVRRGHQHEAATFPKAVIDDQIESKLVQVERQTSILISNEDRHVVDTNVGITRIPGKNSFVFAARSRRAIHRRDYKSDRPWVSVLVSG